MFLFLYYSLFDSLCLLQYTELIKKHFKNFLFLGSYFERLPMTVANESKQKEVS